MRLKGRNRSNSAWYKRISIPFGAIKRRTAKYGKRKYRNISIPFGAIKSNKLGIGLNMEKVFQFLLVRLKVLLRTFYLILKSISIPFGAIKRKKYIEKKDYNFNFNSFWCD